MKYFIRITPIHSRMNPAAKDFLAWFQTYQHILVTSQTSLEVFMKEIQVKISELFTRYPDLEPLKTSKTVLSNGILVNVYMDHNIFESVCQIEIIRIQGEFSYIDEEQQPKGGES